MSAGAGKIGAVVGTFIYQPIADYFGLPAVMWTQAVICLLAVIISIQFLPNDSQLAGTEAHTLTSTTTPLLEDEDEE